jgi:hypothetical protein
MSWQNEMVVLLRHLINDIDAVSYTNSRLEEIILASSQLMLHEVDFDQTYLIDIDTCSLSPDPTTLTTKDDAFINLSVLKAACMVLGSEARTQSLGAVKVVDGPSSIDMTQVYKATQDVAKTACDKYEKAKIDYQINGVLPGLAITTPTTNEGQVGSTRTFT